MIRMSGHQQIEGYNLVQCSEITSSTDVLYSNFRVPLQHALRGRPTYRNIRNSVVLNPFPILHPVRMPLEIPLPEISM